MRLGIGVAGTETAALVLDDTAADHRDVGACPSRRSVPPGTDPTPDAMEVTA